MARLQLPVLTGWKGGQDLCRAGRPAATPAWGVLYVRCCLACLKWRRALGITIESNEYCLASSSISYCSLHPFVLFRIGLACLDVSNAAALLHLPCPGSGLFGTGENNEGRPSLLLRRSPDLWPCQQDNMRLETGHVECSRDLNVHCGSSLSATEHISASHSINQSSRVLWPKEHRRGPWNPFDHMGLLAPD